MRQFFNRKQAQSLVDEIAVRFPGLVVNSSDVHNSKTGEYHYSYIGVWGSTDKTACIATFSDYDAFNQWLEVCQYIASAIADNQQSEEYEANQLIAMSPPPHGPECCCNYCDPNERF